MTGVYGYGGGARVAHEGHIYYHEEVVDPDGYDIAATPPERQLRVVVSGGSMGGLFTAHALRRAGHEVTVYEKTERGKMRGRGGGIVLHPEMLRYMEAEGLANRDDIAMTIDGLRYLDEDGNTLQERDYTIYGSSWDTTYRTIRAELPAERYQMGTEVVSVDQDTPTESTANPGTGNTVTVEFADRKPSKAGLFIAAEGYRSRTREHLFPKVEREYAGYVAWRGLAPEREIPDDIVDALRNRFVIYHGPDFQVLTYPVPGPDGSTTRGDRRINLVWYRNATGEHLEALMRGADGRQYDGTLPPGRMRESVRQEQIDYGRRVAPDVFTRLFETYDEPYVQAVYDLAVPRMVVDRTCLLGDAAFFIRPHMAAGTAHAFADALSLGVALGDYDDLDSALSRWDDRQTALGQRLIRRARERGDRYMNL